MKEQSTSSTAHFLCGTAPVFVMSYNKMGTNSSFIVGTEFSVSHLLLMHWQPTPAETSRVFEKLIKSSEFF